MIPLFNIRPIHIPAIHLIPDRMSFSEGFWQGSGKDGRSDSITDVPSMQPRLRQLQPSMPLLSSGKPCILERMMYDNARWHCKTRTMMFLESFMLHPFQGHSNSVPCIQQATLLPTRIAQGHGMVPPIAPLHQKHPRSTLCYRVTSSATDSRQEGMVVLPVIVWRRVRLGLPPPRRLPKEGLTAHRSGCHQATTRHEDTQTEAG